MKILLYTDNHFCESASIVNKMGVKYSLRLENQIKSINWTEQVAKEHNCAMIICLGDFFDRQSLSDQEITALNEIDFNSAIQHIFLVGNHESEEVDLKYSSTQVLTRAGGTIISEPTTMRIDSTDVCFLPYTIERNIRPLTDIFGPKSDIKRVILSHNDIAGVQMGAIKSKSGFSLDDIEANTDLFLNGHLHNGTRITDKVINLGNLTGKDFGENAFKYRHCAFILDLNTLTLQAIENPYAFNFYQLDFVNEADLKKLDSIKNNAIVKIQTTSDLLTAVESRLNELSDKVLEKRLITVYGSSVADSDADMADLTIDYLQELYKCCKAKIDNTSILEYELNQICK